MVYYPPAVELSVTPAVDDATERALHSALGSVGASTPRVQAYESAWRQAALSEGVERGDADAGYAPSPRSTRGATRA